MASCCEGRNPRIGLANVTNKLKTSTLFIFLSISHAFSPSVCVGSFVRLVKIKNYQISKYECAATAEARRQQQDGKQWRKKAPKIFRIFIAARVLTHIQLQLHTYIRALRVCACVRLSQKEKEKWGTKGNWQITKFVSHWTSLPFAFVVVVIADIASCRFIEVAPHGRGSHRNQR